MSEPGRTLRWLLCAGAGVALLASVSLNDTTLAYERASSAVNTHHYQVRFADQHVGRLRSEMSINRAGQVVAESDFLTRLASDHNSRQRKRFLFAARAPHNLLHAELVSEREGTQSSSTLTRDNQVYVPQIDGHQAALDGDWSFTLGDYLGVELWLQTSPGAGSEMIGRDLDFNALQPTAQVWRVIELNEVGYRLGTGALRAATTIQMNADLVPTRFDILDAISVIAMVERAPLPDLASGMHSRFFHVPIDSRLDNHTAIKELSLNVIAPPALFRAWSLIDSDGVIQRGISASAEDNRMLSPDSQMSSSSDYPTHTSELREVANALVASWRTDDPEQQVLELLEFVHGTLTYEHSARTTDPAQTLAVGRGDCTEYAYLFATLARIIGIPARTVSGLAYSEEPSPGFLLHAWNEVYLDGRWRAVDPTWNQASVDATHLPFPDDEARGLTLLAQLQQTRFELRSVGY